ncbi:NPCBM/NEW2 domain-containing protein [Streptomyces durbertensis]|uniref:NPCBM/NEW2 domain-containing protein n=1 Tax=Streptomyces durbertensis TaxID=2448886 RepID=A0ABR6ENU3_9ACTN|nr:NPCBM/NEW2 domain-containing protein [Streptomyces durbertensis]
MNQLEWDLLGNGEEPVVRLAGSSWVWQRTGPSLDGRPFVHGITVGAPSTVTIDLNRACTTYEAWVGVDDLTVGGGPVRFAVQGDGRQLWRSDVARPGDGPVRVSVPLDGVETIRLTVNPQGPLALTTLTTWADSVIHCR